MRKRRPRKAFLLSLLKYVLLSLFAIPWVLLPLWILIVNSLKTTVDAGTLSPALPKTWNAVANYADVFVEGDYPRALANSLTVVVPSIIAVLLLGSMAAWAFARSKVFSMKLAYLLTVLSILLPPALLPTIFLLQNLGINKSVPGYILVTVATRLGIVVFLTTGFIRGLPADLEEAAAIDGASRWLIYRKIIVPIVSPVLFVGSVLLVISVWNEFFFASFLLPGPDQATLPLALYRFSSTLVGGFVSMRWNLIFANIVMTSLPLVIVYAFAQRRVLGGLTEGGVKG
jgi:raffinose/stachyose/melibiose transport system permease protein